MARHLSGLALNRARAVVAVLALALAGGWAVAVIFGVGFRSLPTVPRATPGVAPLVPFPPTRVPAGRLLTTPAHPAHPSASAHVAPRLALPVTIAAPALTPAPAPVASAHRTAGSGAGGAPVALGPASAPSFAQLLLLGSTGTPRTAFLPTATPQLSLFTGSVAPSVGVHPMLATRNGPDASVHHARPAHEAHGPARPHPAVRPDTARRNHRAADGRLDRRRELLAD